MENTKFIAAQKIVNLLSSDERNQLSDGYHTFGELYDHRIQLFIELCKFAQHYLPVWRSFRHSDDTRFDGWFVLGIDVIKGSQITYHLPVSKWDECGFAMTFDKAPDFDGHTSADVLERLKKLLNHAQNYENSLKAEKSPENCRHEKFHSQVKIGRIMSDGVFTADDSPIGFTADIQVKCIECGTPFHFIGVEHGVSPSEPRISLGGLELRAPIAPGVLEEIPSWINYATFGSQIQSTESEN